MKKKEIVTSNDAKNNYIINMMWIWDVNKSTDKCTILPINDDWWFRGGRMLYNSIEMNNQINKAIELKLKYVNTHPHLIDIEDAKVYNFKIDIRTMKSYGILLTDSSSENDEKIKKLLDENKDASTFEGHLYKNNFYNNIIKWAELNSNNKCSIYIWYDSEYTNIHQIIEAKYLFYEINSNNPTYASIYLKNIRDIDIGDIKLPSGFLNPINFESMNNFTLPLFFRVDLWRMLILIAQLKSDNITYSIYTDLDIIPQTYTYLFTENNIDVLTNTGILTTVSCENYFFILGSTTNTVNDNIIKKINKVIMDSCNYMSMYMADPKLKNPAIRGKLKPYLKSRFIRQYLLHNVPFINNDMNTLQELVFRIFTNVLCINTKSKILTVSDISIRPTRFNE